MEELERDYLLLREVYEDGIHARLIDVENGKKRDADFVAWEAEMDSVLGVIRNQLIENNPEKYHFGNVNKKVGQRLTRYLGRRIEKFSRYGDNGFLICRECKQTFKCDCKCFVDVYESCEEHKGKKPYGTMKKVLDGWSDLEGCCGR